MMKTPPSRPAAPSHCRLAVLAGLALVGTLGACTTPSTQPAESSSAGGSASDPASAADPAYVAKVDAWHADRVKSLKKPTGWLSLVGLVWLDEERNYSLGGGSSADIPLPRAPASVGTLKRAGDLVVLDPAPGSGITVDGQAVVGSTDLRTDAHDKGASEVSLGDVQFHVIDRAGRLGVRIKDPKSEARTDFEGVPRFPVQEDWRVEATLVPFDEPTRVSVPTVLGTALDEPTPGTLRFEVGGTPHELVPLGSKDEGLFIVFGDASNGLPAEEGGTYGGGRFLSARWTGGTTVELDFNKAYNPPCAFTDHATCPLPPSQNKLAVAIPAGEKAMPGSTH